MAQLKDLIVNGASQLIGDVYTSQIQISKLNALTASDGTTYSGGSAGQVLMSNGTNTYWGTPAATVTESTVSGWGFTKNTGTITGATTNGGLKVTGTTLGHSNTAITAKTTAGVYPVKIDALGHITEAGTAIVSSAAASGGTTLSLVTTGDKYTWNNKSTVSISRNLTSGTKIGTITINGTGTDLYCQTNTDTKVTQAAAITTNGSYPILLGYNTGTAAVTNSVNKASALTYNPSTKQMKIGAANIGETGFYFNNGVVDYEANGLDGDPCFIDFNQDYLKLRFSDTESNSIELGNNGLKINDGTGVGTDGQILTSDGTKAYWNSLNIKNGTGDRSLILNKLETNEASGNSSIAGGKNNISSGDYAVTFGAINKNSGTWSITTGQANIASASANGSLTIGNGNLTEEAYAINIGMGRNLNSFKLTGAANATTYTYDSLPSAYNSYTSTFPCIVLSATTLKVAKIVSIDTTNRTVTLDSTISETAISALSCYIIAAQTVSHRRTLLVGAGLRTGTTDQIVVGQYNIPDANSALVIANGSGSAGNNVFTVSKTGAVTADSVKTTKIQAPTAAGGSTYGAGSSGQAFMANGSIISWGRV